MYTCMYMCEIVAFEIFHVCMYVCTVCMFVCMYVCLYSKGSCVKTICMNNVCM